MPHEASGKLQLLVPVEQGTEPVLCVQGEPESAQGQQQSGWPRMALHG